MPRSKAPQRLYEYADIAAETGIPAATLRVWYQRKHMPRADYRVGRSPAWLPATIKPWIADKVVAAPSPTDGDATA